MDEKQDLVPVNVMLTRDLADRATSAAYDRTLSRSAWIRLVIESALTPSGQEN